MVVQEKVKISSIVHKTKVEVNEQGTRAAAVTTAVVIPLMGSTAQKIVVDQPFIFFIYHRESRNIIFEGLFIEPNTQKTVLNTNRYYQVPQRSGHNYPRRDYQRSNNRYQ